MSELAELLKDPEALAKARDPIWRISNLYTIVDRNANVIPFSPNLAQLQLLEALHKRNIILKARQRGFCLDPETRVLTAALEWVPLKDVCVGTELVAVDEEAPGGRGPSRKMRTAVVEGKASTWQRAYRITFEDGRSVVCSGGHRWLTQRGSTAVWRSIEPEDPRRGAKRRLHVGESIRWVTQPWEAGDYQDGWYGGLLDGEGSLALPKRNGANLQMSQREGPVLQQARDYLVKRGYAYREEWDLRKQGAASKLGKAPVAKLVVSRMDELFRMIGQTRPARFIEKRFWEGKDLPGKRSGIGWARIVGITELPEQELLDLQTSTGTFIAEGFVSHNSTLIQIAALDQCLFNDNFAAGILAHTLDAAGEFLKRIQFAYDNLDPLFRDNVKIRQQNASQLVFENGSSIRVDTSLRSGAFQFVHISEFGKICAKYPDKADEVISGTLPALAPNGLGFIESTAEGRQGHFFRMCQTAEGKKLAQARLTNLDWKFHFFSWIDEREYVADPTAVAVSPEDEEYFDGLEVQLQVELTPEKRAWYVAMKGTLGKELMRQEYPSTPEEAFMQSTEGRWYTAQLMKARKEQRIGKFPHDPAYPVFTFWDIGANDETAIWFGQKIGTMYRWIRFIKESGEPFSYFVKALQETGYTWDVHYLPHDAEHKRQQGLVNQSALQMLQDLAPGWRFDIVPKIPEVTHGIMQTRDFLALSEFDEAGCKEGLLDLELYRKEWDPRHEVWKDRPYHGPESNGADAYRQAAQHFTVHKSTSRPKKPKRSTNWRVA